MLDDPTSDAVDLREIHPGEMLREDFLVPMNLTAYRLSKSIGVPQTQIAEIVKGERGISADTAHRLARFFGTSAQLWLGLQNQYDLEKRRPRTARSTNGYPFMLRLSRQCQDFCDK